MVGVGRSGRNEKPLSGMGDVLFSFDGDRTFAIGDEIEFILVKGVGVDLPWKIRGTEKSPTGVAYGIQIGKIDLLQAFQILTSAIFDKFMLTTALFSKV